MPYKGNNHLNYRRTSASLYQVFQCQDSMKISNKREAELFHRDIFYDPKPGLNNETI